MVGLRHCGRRGEAVLNAEPLLAGRSFDAVLCDVDNVIRFYDSAPLAELERTLGVDEGTTQEIAYSPEVDGPFLLGKISPQEWCDAIASELSRRLPEASARELASAMTHAPFRADATVVALLHRIRQHVPLVLVTNASTDLERDLEAMGIADLADHVVSSARVGVAKPDRAIYEIAAESAQVPFHRCLFVDDRAENVDAAAALGMTGVHYGGPADLRAVADALKAVSPP